MRSAILFRTPNEPEPSIEERPFIYPIADSRTVECELRFWGLGKDVDGFDRVSRWGGEYAESDPPEWFFQNLKKSAAAVLFYSKDSDYDVRFLKRVISFIKGHKLPLFVVRCDASPTPPILDGFKQVAANVEGLAEIVREILPPPSGSAAFFSEAYSDFFPRPQFKVMFDSDLTREEAFHLLTALADLYRACGGLGLSAEKAMEERGVHEGHDG